MVIKKCCANCEWCISPENEEEIMREKHYEKDDSNRPKAGDCGWGYNHNGKYVCENHRYNDVCTDTYVVYDDKYLGKGFFIITKYCNEIIKFVKIYRTGSYRLPSYSIRAYEIGSVDTDDRNFREITIEATKGEELFEAISSFANSLNWKCLYSVDKNVYDKNNLSAEVYKNTAFLVFAKDTSKAKYPTDFVDIELGDYLTCKNYEAVSTLFRDFAKISQGQVEEKTVKKILKISK